MPDSISLPIFARALLMGAALALAAQTDAQTLDSKRPPDPVSLQVIEKFDLPFFCIAAGLQADRIQAVEPTKRIPGESCLLPNTAAKAAHKSVRRELTAPDRPEVPAIVVPPGNADDVASKLQPAPPSSAATAATASAAAAATATATATATGAPAAQQSEFLLGATDDKRSVIVFCRARNCGRDQALAALEKTIAALAKPQFAYYQDFTIDSAAAGTRLAKAVPNVNPKLRAEVVSKTSLRLESDKPLLDADLATFLDTLAKVAKAIAAAPAEPEKDPAKFLAPADPAVQVQTVPLPDFCQYNDLFTPPIPFSDKKPCPPNSRKVPSGNFDNIISAINTALGKAGSKLTVTRDGNRLLLACDTKCSGDAVDLVTATIAATARPVPQFVQDIAVPRATSRIVAASFPPGGAIAATALNDTSVRLSSEVAIPQNDLDARLQFAREKGFGYKEAPPLQRMFYRSPAGVVGDLLSTPAPDVLPSLGATAATAPVTGNPAPAATTSAPTTASTSTGSSDAANTATNTVNITEAPPAAPTPAPAPAAPTPGPPPSGTLGLGMTAVDNAVVFTDIGNPAATERRARLLTLLDIPHPEVIMNMWSFQASSPNGKEVTRTLQELRDRVNANNDALQQAIEYGWAYLSRQMRDPNRYFDPDFHNYISQHYVADSPACEAGDPAAKNCITADQRKLWGLCPAGQYCLGYEDAFTPVRPSLTSIILGMMAAKDPARIVLTAIGCMEGKYEVYGPECFPDRGAIRSALPDSSPVSPDVEVAQTKQCIVDKRAEFLKDNHYSPDKDLRTDTLSCDLLDNAAIYAQQECGVPVTLALSCFTIQAAKSFLPDNSFSTIALHKLNSLAELPIADFVEQLSPQSERYSAPSIGLLRGAVADFLYNYKISEQYPQEFGTYALPHSAQELNARLNPLVVAFNQDVAALSRSVLEKIEDNAPKNGSFLQLWRNHGSYQANGLITVRGLSGVESLVDTDTQNVFDATQAKTLNAVLGALTPAASTSTTTPPPTPYSTLEGLVKSNSSAGAVVTAIAAISPQVSHSVIGRQLTLDVIPHTLPGASSAELDVRLWAQEDSAPTVYPESGGSSNDNVSRVARHNVSSRVRVESVKLFDLSSFTAMIQRPRAKFPVLPPFVEIPLVGSLLSIPLPAARIYNASSAVVSAVIVPTAADLAYGITFRADRAVFPEDPKFSRLKLGYSLRALTSLKQLPENAPIERYHNAMVKCLSTNGFRAVAGLNDGVNCATLKFGDLPPER